MRSKCFAMNALINHHNPNANTCGARRLAPNIQDATLTRNDNSCELAIRSNAGDRQALSELLETSEAFIRSLVYRESRKAKILMRDPIMEDILQEARCGLIEAAKRYDSTQGSFRNYAYYWVLQHVKSFLLSDLGTIRVPYCPADSRNRQAADAARWLSARGGDGISILDEITSPDHSIAVIEAEEKIRRIKQVNRAMTTLKRNQYARIKAILDGNEKPPGHGVSPKTWRKSLNCTIRLIRHTLCIDGEMPKIQWGKKA
ncbi:sigma70-ECF, RNA polymerase sigma factor, sigma-70 family [uncultured Caudovirales phage]|uniref:Sigma70-ECF, RNA polymerase sigma factor, sigma-70 family n=1 Tax=uncultured Caudovirales phage TaxID=2100421 RepID=A0A6J5LEI3_9CAUD|nr:sigma70-ECF, RNA polymerase sigma factor, sigma-70 family [uncultured Caudovirales phage]